MAVAGAGAEEGEEEVATARGTGLERGQGRGREGDRTTGRGTVLAIVPGTGPGTGGGTGQSKMQRQTFCFGTLFFSRKRQVILPASIVYSPKYLSGTTWLNFSVALRVAILRRGVAFFFPLCASGKRQLPSLHPVRPGEVTAAARVSLCFARTRVEADPDKKI